MNYQVLSIKWRPKFFSDIVGQEQILITLKNSLTLERIHHAYMFSGTRGIGKTSIARILAKGMNCETGITATPCGICYSCCEIDQGRAVDLIEIDAASKTKVEDTRDLLDNMQYKPVKGRFKIYLIDEVHMLSRHSFNALLKTLEEPFPHVKFLLVTTDPQKIPITVLSRCLQFHLRTLTAEYIYHKLEYILKKERLPYDVFSIKLLSQAANGSLRDALNLADQAIAFGAGKLLKEHVTCMLGLLNNDFALSLIESIVEGNSNLAMKLIDDVSNSGVDWETLIIDIQRLLHRIALFQFSLSTCNVETDSIENRIHKLACIIPPTDVQLYYQIFLIGRKELYIAPNRRIGVEMTVLRAIAFYPQTYSKQKSDSPLKGNKDMSSLSDQSKLKNKNTSVSNITDQVLNARNQLKCKKRENQQEKSALISFSEKKLAVNHANEKYQNFLTKNVSLKSKSKILLKEKNVMRNNVYEEKLDKKRKLIIEDNNINKIKEIFSAELDEDDITLIS